MRFVGPAGPSADDERHRAGAIEPAASVSSAGDPGGPWHEAAQQDREIASQGDDPSSVDAGNKAWAMIALLGLHQRTGNPAYLNAARMVGNAIQTSHQPTDADQGSGDAACPASGGTPRTGNDVEHNLDVYAAFSMLYQLTGAAGWRDGAAQAADVVMAMWDVSASRFRAGMIVPKHDNDRLGQFPLDIHAWSGLALPAAQAASPPLFARTTVDHRTYGDGFSGFALNDERDQTWLEGTGQMTAARAAAAEPAQAKALWQQLRLAPPARPSGAGDGTTAEHDGLSRGCNYEYFRRVYLTSEAWSEPALPAVNAFCQSAGARPPGGFTARVVPPSQWWVAASNDLGEFDIGMMLVYCGRSHGHGEPNSLCRNTRAIHALCRSYLPRRHLAQYPPTTHVHMAFKPGRTAGTDAANQGKESRRSGEHEQTLPRAVAGCDGNTSEVARAEAETSVRELVQALFVPAAGEDGVRVDWEKVRDMMLRY